MSTGRKFDKLLSVSILCIAALSLGVSSLANATPQSQSTPTPNTPSQRRTKTKTTKKSQKPPLTPLPSGPTGPVQQVPLDSMAPVAPQVSYQNEQLTIVANNSTLGDILRAVRKQTGADIDIPSAPDRVVTHLGPGSPRDVMAELLNGSRFNYVLLGSPADNTSLTRVVLVAKSGQDNASPNPNIPSMAGPSSGEQGQPGVVRHSGNPGAPAAELDANAMDAEEDNDTPQEQPPAEAEQPPAPASTDQPGVKTPQQMLQEMQQRQLQLQQQQQQQGQQPTPPPGIPQRPPQE